MLSKCANPSCSAAFLYLRQGKLYQIETSSTASGTDGQTGGTPVDETSLGLTRWTAPKTTRRLEFFWLCQRCSAGLTLAYKKGLGVVPVPLPQVRRAAAA